ncbi:hypothetical protein GGI12_003815 [Dipsacomyces acuminosporus]|nr:hypothetical protein GGI12_003815 [Dipsacomyces acuminosporus]
MDGDRPVLGLEDSSDEETSYQQQHSRQRRGARSKESMMLGIWANDDSDSKRVSFAAPKVDTLKAVEFVTAQTANNANVLDAFEPAPSDAAATAAANGAGRDTANGSPQEQIGEEGSDDIIPEVNQDASETSDPEDSSSSGDGSDSDSDRDSGGEGSDSENGPYASSEHSDQDERPKHVRANPMGQTREAPSKDFGKFANATVWGMMERMGYKHGQGLGMHGEGRVEPVQVKLRRAGEGISYSGSEKPDKPRNQKQSELRKRQTNRNKQIASTPNSHETPRAPRTPAHQKPEYKTLEELQRKTETKLRETFVDMTTNTQAGSFSELAAKKASVDAKEQLSNDIRLGLDLAFSRQENLRRERATEEARLEALNREMQSLTLSAERRESRISNLQAVKEAVSQVQRVSKETKIHSAESAVSDLTGLYAQFASLFGLAKDIEAKGGFDVWSELSLERLVTGSIYDHFLGLMRTWNPVVLPRLLAEVVRPLLRFVNVHDSAAIADEMTPFESVINRTAVPRLKQYLYSHWDPSTDDLTLLLSGMPPVIVSAVSDDLSRVLQKFVDNISPRTIMEKYNRSSRDTPKAASSLLSDLRVDRVLVPWLPFIHAKSDLNATIRRKLCVMLDCWTPTKDNNGDILAVVSPWMEVFEGKELQKLSMKVADRLEIMLRSEFRFDAQRQTIWPFRVLLKWHNILPFKTWFSLVQRNVIGGFLDYLRVWLAQPGANYAEIADWYWQWKSLYPAEIFKEAVVQQEFRQALVYMSYAVMKRRSSS